LIKAQKIERWDVYVFVHVLFHAKQIFLNNCQQGTDMNKEMHNSHHVNKGDKAGRFPQLGAD
jgi:hypothetical protein